MLLWQVPQCTTNIYQQQYQMALFIRKYYQGSSVALNDIGAVNELADIHLLDLWGLASLQVAKARRNNQYGAEEIAGFADQRESGSPSSTTPGSALPVPSTWVRLGTWTIRNNLVAGSDTVSIYAVQRDEVPYLAQCLRDFYRQLPADVIQRGPYLSWTGANQ